MTTDDDTDVIEQANAPIQAARCVEHGDEQGKCHVFLDGGTRCQCGDVDLMRERIR